MAWDLRLLQRLTDHGIPFLIIGGVAAIGHGTNRMTEDLDVCAPLDHDTAVRIIRAFKDIDPIWRMRRDLGVVQEDSLNLHHLKNMYLLTTLGQIDILGEVPGVGTFQDIRDRYVEMVFGGIRCRVVDIDTLIQSKRAAPRNKDKQDLSALLIIREKLKQRHSNDQ